MKAWMFAAAAAVLVAQLNPALAADTPKKPTAQQEKMKTCNKDAKDKALKGDERKAFMKSCLSSKSAAAAASAPASNKK